MQNFKKTETAIFKFKRKKLEGNIKLKLRKKRLYPRKNSNYPGIKIDENLNWKHHV